MKYFLSLALSLSVFAVIAQQSKKATINVDVASRTGTISPMQYGQFIEHLGRAVDGGIYEEKSPLSDSQGFRKDVLEKVKELRTPLLRYPGGTFTKIYHWEDGIGAKSARKKRKNLIWGGVEDNHFGTVEFIMYCRKIGAEPFLVVNMATGTPEEAANWVEYCNGTGDTHYANLRRSHGFKEPFYVKFWGIGNEEYADTDAGKDQDVQQYIKDTWLFVKLMKLQDPEFKLILVGNQDDTNWSRQVLEKLGPVCDYLAIHLYAIPKDTSHTALIKAIDDFEKPLSEMESLLAKFPQKAENFNAWYRFPARKEPIKLALDEWGIWDLNSKSGKGRYQMEYQYNWSHALGVATFLNLFQRHSESIGMATWAQTVNILAPIMTNATGSYRQTVFAPLKAFRDYAGKYALKSSVLGPDTDDGFKALDVAASTPEEPGKLILTIVNRDAKHSVNTRLNINHLPGNFKNATVKQVTFTGKSLKAVNTFNDESSVMKSEKIGTINLDNATVTVPAASFTVLVITGKP